jgi:predicted RNase H-like HicB family nuclease
MEVEGVRLEIEIEREADGRWLADIPTLPGVMAYGATREQAIANVKVLALRVIADEIEHGERSPDAADTVFAIAA